MNWAACRLAAGRSVTYVLIVDDDQDFSEAVAARLPGRWSGGRRGLHAEEHALAAVQERRPDVVVLDVMFPENPGAGFELARDLRRKYGQLPILRLTAVN